MLMIYNNLDSNMDLKVITYYAEWLCQKVGEASELAIGVLNSNFTIALFSSLTGAFAGAVAAQGVIEKNKHREIFLTELRHANAAITVSFSICNTMLALKSQHSLPLYEKFKKDQVALKEFKAKLNAGLLKPGEKFDYVADFKTFSAPSIPIEMLKNLVFDKISSPDKALSAVSYLEGAYAGLKEVLCKRENMIAGFKSGTITEEETPYFYFGLRMPSGHTNQEHPDLIEAICSYINDVIFFSSLICKDLMQYGEHIRKKEKKFSKKAPQVNTADFSTPGASKLMPPDSDYSAWLGGFKEKE